MAEGPVDFRLYLITDRSLFCDEAHFLGALGAALAGGVRAVQLREKDLPAGELLRISLAVRDLTRRHGARLFINDRADIARCVGADGVHLGQGSLPPRAARLVIGKGPLIGLSTHSQAEAVAAAEQGADFITLGPVFETPSKKKYGAPLGINLFREVAGTCPLPVFAIGGIKPENLTEVVSAKAGGVALISGILAARDIKSAAENYLRSLGA